MILHLSTFSQWFFPFGNFILPLVLWSTMKKDSRFIDHHGRQAINFQLSLLVYTLVLAMIAIPIAMFTIFKHVPFRAMVHDEVYVGHELTPENISGIAILAIMAAVVFCFLKVAEFFLVIYASVKATDGVEYEYPLCIPFIRSDRSEEAEAEAEAGAEAGAEAVAEAGADADADADAEITDGPSQNQTGVQSSSASEEKAE